MPINLNNAEPQREMGALIPDGTFVRLKGKLRPGEYTLPGEEPADNGLFKKSGTSDVVMLDWEFTVLQGKYAKQKIWQFMTVSGGQLDDKGNSKGGNVTKSMLRAMVDSALGLDPKDMSDAAQAKRMINSYSEFDGIEFVARIGVEKGGEKAGGGTYDDKNRIAYVVEPNDQEWKLVMEGQEVPPKPSGVVRGGRPGAGAATAGRSWQGGTAASGPAAATGFRSAGTGNGAAAPGAATAEAGGGRPNWVRSSASA
jgi:hypothetical protein